MFVVIALMIDFPRSEQLISAFGTPTVIHFSGVLLLSAIMSAPWPSITSARFALGALGSLGVIYMVVVGTRTLRQTTYKPVFEDWLFHIVLPLIAYLGILTAGAVLERAPGPLLFVIGAAAVLLIVVGIHNAWDTVKYIVLLGWEKRSETRNETRRGKDEWS
jgi:hypothetical protein